MQISSRDGARDTTQEEGEGDHPNGFHDWIYDKARFVATPFVDGERHKGHIGMLKDGARLIAFMQEGT